MATEKLFIAEVDAEIEAGVRAIAAKDAIIKNLLKQVNAKKLREKDEQIKKLQEQLGYAPKQPVAVNQLRGSLVSHLETTLRSEAPIHPFFSRLIGHVPKGAHIKLCRQPLCGGGVWSEREIIGRNPHEGVCPGLTIPSKEAKALRDDLVKKGFKVKL